MFLIVAMNNVSIFTIVLLGAGRNGAQIILTLQESITYTSYLL